MFKYSSLIRWIKGADHQIDHSEDHVRAKEGKQYDSLFSKGVGYVLPKKSRYGVGKKHEQQADVGEKIQDRLGKRFGLDQKIIDGIEEIKLVKDDKSSQYEEHCGTHALHDIDAVRGIHVVAIGIDRPHQAEDRGHQDQGGKDTDDDDFFLFHIVTAFGLSVRL